MESRRRVLGEYAALTVGLNVFAGELVVNAGTLYERLTDGTISGTFTPANWKEVGGAPRVLTPTLSGAHTLTTGGRLETWEVATLTTNETTTIPDLGAGCTARLFYTQDGTGGRSVTITNGVLAETFEIPGTPGQESVITVFSRDGAALDVTAPLKGAVIQTYSAAGDYSITPPVGAKTLSAFITGSSAGACSGGKQPPLTAAISGASSGAAGASEDDFDVAALTWPMTLHLGTPGVGGAAVATPGTPGNVGTAGAASWLGPSAGASILGAPGGVAPPVPTATTSALGAAQLSAQWTGPNGNAGGSIAGLVGGSGPKLAGGGAGAGVSAAGAEAAGGAPGRILASSSETLPTGGAVRTAGADGADPPAGSHRAGGAGTGGGSSSTAGVAAGAGGRGKGGSGSGGGGAATDAAGPSGKGGDGSQPRAVLTWGF